MKIENLEKKAKDALVACLQDVPFLNVDPDVARLKTGQKGPDTRIALQLSGNIRGIIYLLEGLRIV